MLLQHVEGGSKVHIVVDLGLFWCFPYISPEQRVQSTLHLDALRTQVTFNRFQPLGSIRTDAPMLNKVLEYSQLAW